MPPSPTQGKIPAHVLNYFLALLPACGYAYYYNKNRPSDEELEKVLRANYADKIKSSESKRVEFVKMIADVKGNDNDNGDNDSNDNNNLHSHSHSHNQKTQQMFAEVLSAGKGEIKRHYDYDRSMYGTEEGARIAAEEWEKSKEKLAKKNKKKSPRVSLQKKSSPETTNASPTPSPTTTPTSTLPLSLSKEHGAIAVVAILAASMGYFFGNSRR